MSTLSFGKAIEYKVASEMTREGFEVYLPIADDHGVDLIARTPLGNIVEVQVKALSKTSKGNGLFASINHTPRPNFYFVFYVEVLDKTWILSSEDFISMASKNTKGKHPGKYSIAISKKACAPFCATDYSYIR